MADYDLIIRNGSVVSGESVTVADVAVGGGTIAAVGELSRAATGTREIDARGRFVLPGVIDAHTHPVYADDLRTMTLAGASAGVTSVISFVGALPSWGFPKSTPSEVVDDYVAKWDGAPALDFALHVAFDSADDPATEVPKLVERGVTSFKFFTAYRQRGMMTEDRQLIAGFEAIARAGGIAAVHAENGDGIEFLESKVWDDPALHHGAFLACHTELFEAEAVLRVIALAEAVGCPIYIPHLAAGDGIDAARIARRSARVPVWIETCPHYLVLTNDEVLDRGALSKIAPPLRAIEDNDRLWGALADGSVQIVGTDHAGRTLAMKAQGVNILQAPYGAEGIEHLLPLVYGEGVARGRLDITRLAAVLAENPADLFGLDAKGRIQVGKDADIAILDPEGSTVCSVSTHVGLSDYCLYEGREVAGRVTHTIRRGEVLLDDGVLAESPTGGRFITRLPASLRALPTVR